jgi:mannose-6-phosphate isomerase-like protein (cupin superfamily)
MRHLVAVTTLISMAVAAPVSAGDFPKHVHYVPHEKAMAAFVKGERVIEDEGLIVGANRNRQGAPEVHAKTNHVFIIVEGEADFVTGGKLLEPKEPEAGTTHGTGIQGGEVHHLTKGDIITVPAGTPHQWKDTSRTGSIVYYAVNVLD